MVNSKKMSKSTVAIVLLSLLLVLSLILTATGAWFTSGKSDNGQVGDKINMRADWLEVTVTASEQGALTLKRTVNGTEETVTDHNDAMPGDTIEVSDVTGAQFVIKNDKGYAFYYIIVKDGAVIDNEAKYVAKNGSADLSAIVAGDVKAETGMTTGSYTVDTSLTQDKCGALVLTLADTSAYGVYAIQAENMDATTALTELKAIASIA